MVEVMFGESEAGAMKLALHQNRALGDDVVCLGFMLDCGKISESVTGEYRRRLFVNTYCQDQWGFDWEMKKELSSLGKVYSENLDKLRGYLNSGESIRIWYSDAPYSLCGLMWLCGELFGCPNEVYAVKLPRLTVSGNVAVEHSSWGEVEPNDFERLLPFQRRLSPAEMRALSDKWLRLKAENAPLRAFVNGSVISVPANFYDFLIFKYLGDSPVKEAVLIGKILCENPLGIGDWWYAHRIEKFIEQKRIIVIENSDEKYRRIIAKNIISGRTI